MATQSRLRFGLLIPVAAVVLFGCPPPVDPGAGNTGGESTGGGGGTPPPATAALTFTIDDTANQVYEESDGLAWKGSFSYDDGTGELTFDGLWGGPYPPLYDDGTHGDVTAGDHIWTVTVDVEPLDATDIVIEYGAIRNSVNGSDGQWIWTGSNGTVTVAAGDTSPVEADPLVLPPFGTVDLKVTLDTGALGSPFVGADPTSVEIKSSAWGWYLKSLHDDGTHGDASAADDVYTMQFSLDQDRLEGLLELDQDVEFMFELDGVEYKDAGAPIGDGVTAETDWATPGSFSLETVSTAGPYNLELIVGNSDEPG